MVDELAGPRGSLHCVGFSGAGLAVCEYAGIVPIQCSLYKRLDLVKHLFLGGIWQKYLVEVVDSFAVLRHVQLDGLVLHWHYITVCILLQLRESNQILIEHGQLILGVVDGFDPAEDSHVSFEVRDLLLLDLSD